MEIRQASIADSDDLARVHMNSWLTTYKGIVKDSFLDKVEKRYRSGDATEKWIGLFKRSSGLPAYVSLVEDRIVGFVSGGKNRFSHYPYQCEIYAIYIEQKHQQNGIGRGLVKAFIDQYMIPNRLNSLSIHVLKRNPSAAFYQRIGGLLVDSKWEEIAETRLEIDVYGWEDIESIK